MSDLRYALRSLSRSPGFASVAILSLALGIGANAAIYSVIRAALLDPLPVRAPEEIVAAGWTGGPARPRGILSINSTSYRDERTGLGYGSNFSYTLYRAFQQAGGHELFAFSYAASDLGVSFGGQSVLASGLLVSGNYFPVLGVATVLGRPLNESDDRPDAPPVAVVTHSFWRRALGGDPGILQRTIHVNGASFTIVGVTAPGFFGMSKGGPFFKPSDVLMPLSVQPLVYTRSNPRVLFNADDRWWIQVMARVAPGAEVSRLEAVLNAAFRSTLAASSLPQLREASAGELRLIAAPRGLDSWTRSLRQPLLILGGVVAVVLVIACMNVGTLLLVRGVARQKELSIRLALGSSRWRLMRGMLAESAVLAALGGALGTLIAVWGARALVATMVAGSSRTAIEIGVDGRLLLTTIAISGLAALLFGAIPAVKTLREGIASVLKRSGAATSAPHLGAWRILMAAQIGISLPLLVGAALFLRTVYNLGQVDLGFNPERLLLFRLDPSLHAYDADRVERLYGQVLQKLSAIPGVTSATVTDIVLLSRLQNNWTFLVPGSEPKNVKFARIGPAYFETLGIPVLAGRSIGIQDHSRAPRVAVLNETAARTLFGSGSPVGQRLTMQSDQPADFEIVGVVKDSRYTSPRDPMPPTVYLPYAQTTLGRLGPMNVLVRSSAALSSMSAGITAAVAEVDPNLPVADLRTQMNQIDETLGSERLFTRLLVAFGAFALLLANLGLHGVTAFSVARRTSEIGVRVALGARHGDVLWLILRQVIGITLAGLALGVPAAIASTRLIRASLYGVEPADPASVAAAAALMATVAILAGFFPARRAARLDPLAALRTE
jgi:predicted permease